MDINVDIKYGFDMDQNKIWAAIQYIGYTYIYTCDDGNALFLWAGIE